ncbi:hypothetical protein JKP88DRAFT_298880 [Tribonema minus]|uniref:beta-glucosidase n=1 Tax=Tribonema minus TaxID=303371 RepID=A0A835ZDS0_9STRA|nr:hypothetical protein JKP88DRAFT_298880 [Tribonema minus]
MALMVARVQQAARGWEMLAVSRSCGVACGSLTSSFLVASAGDRRYSEADESFVELEDAAAAAEPFCPAVDCRKMMGWAAFVLGAVLLAMSKGGTERLLLEMTLQDKFGQMLLLDLNAFIQKPTVPSEQPATLDEELLRQVFRQARIGGLFNSPAAIDGLGWSATEWRAAIAAREGSKIPVLMGIDTIHGANYVRGAVMGPHQLALAATFRPELAERAGRTGARDSRAAALPWLYSPVMGVAHSPLWPRVYETFGEDPLVAATMGAAMFWQTRILGARDRRALGAERHALPPGAGNVVTKFPLLPRRLASQFERDTEPLRAAACAKHFLGYPASASGHDRDPVVLGERELLELYLPPWRAVIGRGSSGGGALSVMEGYHELDGVPMASSKHWLHDVLRGDLGFEGMLVTDYGEIANLYSWHGVAPNVTEAMVMALRDTSIDVGMFGSVPPQTAAALEAALRAVGGGGGGSGGGGGRVAHARLDASVRRVLALKEAVGLLDEPVPALASPLLQEVGSAADVDDVVAAAAEAVTLLKNEGGALPLAAKGRGGTLLVTGPSCDSLAYLSGGWSIHWQGAAHDGEFGGDGTTILQGLAAELAGAANWKVAYRQGVDIHGQARAVRALALRALLRSAADDYDDALADARGAAAIVACIGEPNYTEKPGDLNDAALPRGLVDFVGIQNGTLAPRTAAGLRSEGPISALAHDAQLRMALGEARAAAATRAPLVLVLVQGRQRLLGAAVAAADAILHAYLPAAAAAYAHGHNPRPLRRPRSLSPMTSAERLLLRATAAAAAAGPHGGRAIAKVLAGRRSPSGRLPVTYPRSAGHAPLAYHHKVGARCADADGGGLGSRPCQRERGAASAIGGAVRDAIARLDLRAALRVVRAKRSGELECAGLTLRGRARVQRGVHGAAAGAADHAPGSSSVTEVEWWFGEGLSYTTFEYTGLALSRDVLNEDQDVTVSVTVTNTGKRQGADAVLLFSFSGSRQFASHRGALPAAGATVRAAAAAPCAHMPRVFTDEGAARARALTHTGIHELMPNRPHRRVTPRYRRLRAFAKVDLAPGEARALEWRLSARDLAYVGVDKRLVLEDAVVTFGVGPQADCRAAPVAAGCAALRVAPSPRYSPICAAAACHISISIPSLPLHNGVCLAVPLTAAPPARPIAPICAAACDVWFPPADAPAFPSSSFDDPRPAAAASKRVPAPFPDRAACARACGADALPWTWNYVACLEGAARSPYRFRDMQRLPVGDAPSSPRGTPSAPLAAEQLGAAVLGAFAGAMLVVAGLIIARHGGGLRLLNRGRRAPSADTGLGGGGGGGGAAYARLHTEDGGGGARLELAPAAPLSSRAS